ncbi:MAG TPA: hypothetical protein VGM87_02415 [Roseomonas sp.]|jgi:uncharacterized protein YbjT (DUF2867 family)
MKIILYGATGTVGQGVLRRCLMDPDVEQVLAVGRASTGRQHPKLCERVRADLMDYSGLDAELTGYDACCYCLGVSSAGLDEARYTRITYDLALAAATTLVRLNPGMRFLFVSGAGARSGAQGGAMWQRVKGRTENALLRLPFRAVHVFRPGAIQPMHGIRARTASYRLLYPLLWLPLTLLRLAAPALVTTTDALARAMLRVAQHGAEKPILEGRDIHALSQGG